MSSAPNPKKEILNIIASFSIILVPMVLHTGRESAKASEFWWFAIVVVFTTVRKLREQNHTNTLYQPASQPLRPAASMHPQSLHKFSRSHAPGSDITIHYVYPALYIPYVLECRYLTKSVQDNIAISSGA